MTKTKRLTVGVAGAFLAASLTGLAVAPAHAGHCSDPNDRPGNSEFSDHVRNSGDDHHEGEHQGWSSCEEQANSDNENANRNG